MNIKQNTLSFLKEVYILLEQAGISAWVFGGWAEELHHIISPRAHNDIDLLYPADSLDAVDQFIERNVLRKVKDFPHKRAFIYNGIMVEIFLVDKKTFSTNFFSIYTHVWPHSTFTELLKQGMRVVSIETLKDYREKHHLVEKAEGKYLK